MDLNKIQQVGKFTQIAFEKLSSRRKYDSQHSTCAAQCNFGSTEDMARPGQSNFAESFICCLFNCGGCACLLVAYVDYSFESLFERHQLTDVMYVFAI